MLKDIKSIELQGANFLTKTILPILDSSDKKPAQLFFVYGRNGAGKSTIAKSFRMISGESMSTIPVANALDRNAATVTLTEEEKAHLFVFDEDFVNDNVRIEGNGLGSIVMLGEQADLSAQIEKAYEELNRADADVAAAGTALQEYLDGTNPKAPKFYIQKMYHELQKEGGWADREKKAKGRQRKSKVSEETYKTFIKSVPSKTRDVLIGEYNSLMKDLEKAKTGVSVISTVVPVLTATYSQYSVTVANELLKKKIEKPELNGRERYLLMLAQNGNTEELRRRLKWLNNEKNKFCPYCLKDFDSEYKTDLVSKIQKVLSDEVELHQRELNDLILEEVQIDLRAFSALGSCAKCMELIEALNERIGKNNSLLQMKAENPYNSILEMELLEIASLVEEYNDAAKVLEEERKVYNKEATETGTIVDELCSLNDQITYYDVIQSAQQYEIQKSKMESAEKKYKEALSLKKQKQSNIEALDARRKRIDIAIDIINNSLKYIFFTEGRLEIEREGDFYKLKSHGQKVDPKNVSVGERNIIGLCYFFAKMLQGKDKETAYNEEYLIVIDDPISSNDFDNKVGILSYIRYKLDQILAGNPNSRVIVLTHDLLTMYDLEKIGKEITDTRKLKGKQFAYTLNELRDCAINPFGVRRQEYTEMLKLVYDYAQGNALQYDIVIGNIMRQVVEAYSTFVYKTGMDKISTDDSILDAAGMCEAHKEFFKNLMYRIVLNGGSHREDQAKSLEIDFAPLVSTAEKQKIAKGILCLIYLLNQRHVRAHLGNSEANIIDQWCETIRVGGMLL